MNGDGTLDLGLADAVEPEAIGKPGNRTFKISATSSRGTAVIWLEKEQLFQVAVAIKQFLSSRAERSSPAPFVPETPEPNTPVSIEFRTGEMSLRHDAGAEVFTIEASEAGAEGEEEDDNEEPAPAVQFSFTRLAGEALADRALEICAAGRKPCPLCGAPINPDGHFCVKKNGHNSRAFPTS